MVCGKPVSKSVEIPQAEDNEEFSRTSAAAPIPPMRTWMSGFARLAEGTTTFNISP